MEIEKRYDIKNNIPLDDIKSKTYIEQVYSNINPDVRIRYTKNSDGKEIYYHTVKYNTSNKNSRIEIEQNISKDLYHKIYKLIDKKPVRKNRYIIPLGNGLDAEVDEFLDTDDIIVEVEFIDEEQMNNFVKPNWFGNEIENNKSFSVQIFSKVNCNDIYEQIRQKYESR